MKEQNKFDLVDKYCFEADPYHAPFETITADNRNKAKYKYINYIQNIIIKIFYVENIKKVVLINNIF